MPVVEGKGGKACWALNFFILAQVLPGQKEAWNCFGTSVCDFHSTGCGLAGAHILCLGGYALGDSLMTVGDRAAISS